MKIRKSQTEKLRELLIAKEFIPVPSCFDTLSAKLIEQANFDVTLCLVLQHLPLELVHQI